MIKDMYEDGYFPLTVADKATEKVMAQPTVDAVEVVHGEWKISSDGYYPYCSICNYRPKGGEMTKHCPDCGAKMNGGIGTAEDICKTTNIPCIKCNPGPCEHRKKG